jgi:hypothetical protein
LGEALDTRRPFVDLLSTLNSLNATSAFDFVFPSRSPADGDFATAARAGTTFALVPVEVILVMSAILLFCIGGCASQGNAVPARTVPSGADSTGAAPAKVISADLAPAYSPESLSLDEAINDASAYFIERLPAGTAMAIVSFETPSGSLSDYIFEELWSRFEISRKFIMVDRRNLDRIRAEINYQMSGTVSDESARSIGRQYGAQHIVYGQVSPLGDEYRLVVYATDVETASSNQRALTVKPDTRLSSLLRTSLDDQINRAVADLARGLDTQITIAIGRISYTGTQTVSSLSALPLR